MFKSLPSRNNTSFSKELFEVLKQIKLSKDDFLRYHQKLVVEYIMKYEQIRGFLAYHKMGSGKTILGVAICEILLKVYPNRKVYFISNKSLHSNFKNALQQYFTSIPDDKTNVEEHIAKSYRFITLNASNALKQLYAATKGDINLAELVQIDEKLVLDEDEQPAAKKPTTDDLQIDLNDSIVIHDEFHNMLNSISNGSKNAIGLYDAEMRATNIKIIGLTGTPIINSPFEAALAFNLFQGPIPINAATTKPAKGKSYTTLFGEDYQDFVRMFVENPDAIDPDSKEKQRPRIKNADKFSDRILGLVSYFGADLEEHKTSFPLEYDIVVKRVPMSLPQYATYVLARDKELEEGKKGVFKQASARLKKATTSTISSYRVRSRQVSNFLYPSYASKIHRESNGHLIFEFNLDKLKPISLTTSDEYTQKLPKTKKTKQVIIKNQDIPETEVFDEEFEKIQSSHNNTLETLSPKIVSLLENLSLHTPKGILDKFKPSKAQLEKIIANRTKKNATKLSIKKLKQWKPGVGPSLVYSQFLETGVKLVGKILEANGMKEVSDTPNPAGTFAIISGEQPPELRDLYIKMFNDPANIDGSILTVLLITSTGAEGLDLKNGRSVHVMEPYWNFSRPRQIITRIVRFRSHIDLPLEEQTVQPYIYLSDYPTSGSSDVGAQLAGGAQASPNPSEDLRNARTTSQLRAGLARPSDDMTAGKLLSDVETRMKQEMTTDVVIYYKAIQNQMLIDDFLRVIQESSIDCLVHYESRDGSNCRICAPTGKQLWHADIHTDIDQPSPCEPYQKTTIITKSITISTPEGDKEFRYTQERNKYRIFEFQPRLQAYTEIFSDHPLYATLLKTIK